MFIRSNNKRLDFTTRYRGSGYERRRRGALPPQAKKILEKPSLSGQRKVSQKFYPSEDQGILTNLGSIGPCMQTC